MQTLEPETVAEAIVNQVLSGSSGQIVLPGFLNFFTFLRGLPHWYQIRTRAGAEALMKTWKGRQVIDVEKRYELKKQDSQSE